MKPEDEEEEEALPNEQTHHAAFSVESTSPMSRIVASRLYLSFRNTDSSSGTYK
jgi:hypothetical protein